MEDSKTFTGPKSMVEGMKWLLRDNKEAVKFYDFLLDNGKQKKTADLTSKEKSEVVACTRRRRGIRSACFYNAQMLTLDSCEKLTYHEGYAASEELGIPLEHAWNEFNGKVIDNTWKKKKVTYFGVKIPIKFIRHQIVEKEKSTDMMNNFWRVCVRPLQEGGKKVPEKCGDMDEYKI